MGFSGAGIVWMNGRLVPWKDATLHVGSHVIHYGTGVFEGARCYATPNGPACFRLDDHLRRLQQSAKVYRMEYPLDLGGWREAVFETIRANRMEECYVRPLIYRGYETLGVNPLGNPVEAAVLVWAWNGYLGHGVLDAGVDVKVSTWTRPAPNTLPAMAKATANYASSALIKMEAVLDGYAEGLALDASGVVSEASGQNVFIVRDGVLQTPPLSASILGGITRGSVMILARDLGIPVVEVSLPRESLYVADEAFLAGTATEVVPIRSIDRITIGSGRRGPITEALQQTFFSVVRGELPDVHGWLSYMDAERAGAIASGASVRV